MKNHFATLALAIAGFGMFAAGCTHESGAAFYHEGKWPQIGYSDTKASDGATCVTFSSGGNKLNGKREVSNDLAEDLIRLRAAELCKINHCDYFTVCGYGGTSETTASIFGITLCSDILERCEYFEFFKTPPADGDSFNASKVIAELKAKRGIQ